MSDLIKTDNALVPQEERFPHAQTPGAQELAEVFAAWQARGLEPVEVTPEQTRQTITIAHDVLTGQLEWRTDRLDGVQALGLMAETLRSMYQYFIDSPGRPRLSSGVAQIAIRLDGDHLQLLFEPTNDPVVIKGVLLAALWSLIEQTGNGEVLTGLLEWDRA